MSCIYKDSIRLDHITFHALQQDIFENLFEQISSFKPSFVVLSECAEMRDFIVKIQSKKPAICHIDFDFANRLTHTVDPVHVLNDRDFDQCDRIDTRSSSLSRILFFYQIIDKVKIDIFIDFP